MVQKVSDYGSDTKSGHEYDRAEHQKMLGTRSSFAIGSAIGFKEQIKEVIRDAWKPILSIWFVFFVTFIIFLKDPENQDLSYKV